MAEEDMFIERKKYNHLTPPVGPYVHAVKSAGFTFLSGITAFRTPAQGKSMAIQAKTIFEQIRSNAEAEECNLSALVKVAIFITSFAEIARVREVLFNEYREFFPPAL
jgi:2-iminobutanoate/2-iminopropanoate deaminase